jgi:predicted dehydrogenase
MTPEQIEALKAIEERKGLFHAVSFHVAYNGPHIAALLDDGLFDVGDVVQSNGRSYPAVYLTKKGRRALSAAS